MTEFFTTHIRLFIWAVGAVSVVAELAALTLLVQPATIVTPDHGLPDMTVCHTLPRFEAAPLTVTLPMELSL
ncbi:MAG: hypothetical protein HKN70_10130 [Gammaproteobacteria bacterium]|nr:hypothetical protein [Gammaproteobacteria bacterium]